MSVSHALCVYEMNMLNTCLASPASAVKLKSGARPSVTRWNAAIPLGGI